MSRPTIIINDLDAETHRYSAGATRLCWFANRRRVKRRVGSRPNVFARRDATRRGDNEQPGLNSAILAMAKCVCATPGSIRQKMTDSNTQLSVMAPVGAAHAGAARGRFHSLGTSGRRCNPP